MPHKEMNQFNIRQKLVLKVTKSKNREAISEQRIMNQINHPNILFSYGLIYPENFKKLDFKTLEKYLPKKDKKQMMSSVDKLMKKNKYGERQFPNFEKNRSPLLKHYGEVTGNYGLRKKGHSKLSVSPNPPHAIGRKRFNFSKTFKEFELQQKPGKTKEIIEDAEQINPNNPKNQNNPTDNIKLKKTTMNQINKYKVSLIRNRRHKSKNKEIVLILKLVVIILLLTLALFEIVNQVRTINNALDPR
jgi:hypothetical protein